MESWEFAEVTLGRGGKSGETVVETASKPAVGIDLGTTHSVIAYLDDDGRPRTIKNAEGDATTPSAVFFDASSPVVGKEALKAALHEPGRIARFAKRDIGRAAFHKTVGGERIPPEVVEALVLGKLRRDAELKLGRFQKVVITVPAFFNEPRRKATQDAGRLAGLDVLDIINEPTAAAIAFGVEKGFLTADGRADRRRTILVYDLGGGTFDVTLMDIQGRNYVARATTGDVYLGGIDWDCRIVDYVADEFEKRHGSDPRSDPAARERLMREAEDAKHALSAREEAAIHFEYAGNRLQLGLDRKKFESLTGDLLERTLFTTRNLLRDAGLAWGDLTRLLLVGGSTRMPMISESLRRESGMQVDRSLSPDEAVAHGAAVYAGLLSAAPESQRPKVVVRNVNSHDLGVLAIERATARPRRQVLIPRNTPLPASGRSLFVTRREDQRRVMVNVIEGGDDSGKNATPVGKCVVSDLPPGLPAKTPVEVRFTYAENGRLTVEARLPQADREATLSIQRASGLPEAKLAVWAERIKRGLTVGTETAEPPPVQTPAADADGPPRRLPKALPLEADAGDVEALPAESPAPNRAPAEDPDLDEFLKKL